MLEQDRGQFAGLFTAVSLNYGRDVTEALLSLWWAQLQRWPFAVVSEALSAHVERSRFMPTIAEVIEWITAADASAKRPGADEAWAMVPKDEDSSAMLTAEMLGAWGVARRVLAEGAIHARRAFVDAYQRLCAEAVARREPVRWVLSQGHDKARLAEVVDDALAAGLLSSVEAQPVLLQLESYRRPVGGGLAGMLAAPEVDEATREKAAAFLRGIRAGLMGEVEPVDWEQVYGELDEMERRMAGEGGKQGDANA